MQPQQLTVSSALHDLPLVINFVRRCCRTAGLSEDASFACELAADEACSNIMEHAYSGRSDGVIHVACWVAGQCFVLRFRDHGRTFDPARVQKPTLDADLLDRPVGKLGIHIMRSLMDDVRYEFDAVEGNTLTMSKAIPAQPVAD